MSATVTSVGLVAGMAPVNRRIRAYFAPVNRASGKPTIFDAAQSGLFALHAPPSPWIDLGWCSGFSRKCGTKVTPMRIGAPAVVQQQVRTEIEATFTLAFESWGKLQLALASGSQQMNLLSTAAQMPANGSGGSAAVAVPLLTTGAASTSTALNVGVTNASRFHVGDLVAVDMDYTGQTGYVGSGVSGAYVRAGVMITDVNYVRRVTLNVGRVVGISNGILQIGESLLAGVPANGMQVSQMVGFADREGGSFFQEWSGLLCSEGEQGDRILYHYPRLQTVQGSAEQAEPIAGSMQRMRLAGAFRALPVQDAIDGETVLCFRSYVPSATATIR